MHEPFVDQNIRIEVVEALREDGYRVIHGLAHEGKALRSADSQSLHAAVLRCAPAPAVPYNRTPTSFRNRFLIAPKQKLNTPTASFKETGCSSPWG